MIVNNLMQGFGELRRLFRHFKFICEDSDKAMSGQRTIFASYLDNYNPEGTALGLDAAGHAFGLPCRL